MRNGAVYQQPIVELGMRETDFGYLGTPTASQDFKPIRKLTPSEINGSHGKILVGSIGEVCPYLIGQYLKPSVTESLMGWITEWTDLKPLAMDKFQEWLQQHSLFLNKE